MNFPSNPTNGQEYTYGDQTWRWSSATSTWDLVALASVSLNEALAARDEAVAAANLAVSSLALKANIGSPAFTGTPTAPTATPGTSTTQIATTAFASAAAIAAASASWIDYTPTVTSGSGTITTLGALNCSYCQRSLQKAVDIRVSVVITTNGTAGTLINVSLPVAARSGRTFVMAGREAGVNGKMLQGVVVGSTLSVVNFDNTYPGLDGATLILSGTYEIA